MQTSSFPTTTAGVVSSSVGSINHVPRDGCMLRVIAETMSTSPKTVEGRERAHAGDPGGSWWFLSLWGAPHLGHDVASSCEGKETSFSKDVNQRRVNVSPRVEKVKKTYP